MKKNLQEKLKNGNEQTENRMKTKTKKQNKKMKS